MRVGGERPIKTDVRVIAATNVDLEEAIREKTFREDLYYRLNVVRLEIPPLQQRSEDIPLLAEHFAHLFNPRVRISPGAMRLLQNHGWPGNIRELANVMRRAVVMCPDDTILPSHLNNRFKSVIATAASLDVNEAAEFLVASELFLEQSAKSGLLERGEPAELERLLQALHGIKENVLAVMRTQGGTATAQRGLKETEAETIKNVLDRYRWHITETARALGIGRNTLYRKIKQFNLTR
jgi:two-component system NtrC family response regulator